VFTAPTAGHYLFSASVVLKNVTGGAIDMDAIFSKNSGAAFYYMGNREAVPNNGTVTITGTIVVAMAASDTMKVVYGGTGNATVVGNAIGTTRSMFFGRRVL
jgi:hypothetical protein